MSMVLRARAPAARSSTCCTCTTLYQTSILIYKSWCINIIHHIWGSESDVVACTDTPKHSKQKYMNTAGIACACVCVHIDMTSCTSKRISCESVWCTRVWIHVYASSTQLLRIHALHKHTISQHISIIQAAYACRGAVDHATQASSSVGRAPPLHVYGWTRCKTASNTRSFSQVY